MFTSPPLFDVGNKSANEKISNILGSRYTKICSRLAINASNAGLGWIHYWDNDGFKYDVIDSKQVIPIWSDTLEHIFVYRLPSILLIFSFADLFPTSNNGGDVNIYDAFWSTSNP